MARILGTVVLTVGALVPTLATAQVYQFQTPPPPVTAQSADWQTSSAPIVVNSLLYYPTRETRFFDGGIMAQVGVYASVPVYADVTLEPHSVVYVPVGRNLMRGYELRREGPLAGTQGSRVPAFRVDIPSSIQPREERMTAPGGELSRELTSAPRNETLLSAPRTEPTDVGSIPRPARTHVESIPLPTTGGGVWLEWNGQRWYSDGPATVFTAERFTQVGDYRGFPVYRDTRGRADEIWIAVVKDGPLAPYGRKR